MKLIGFLAVSIIGLTASMPPAASAPTAPAAATVGPPPAGKKSAEDRFKELESQGVDENEIYKRLKAEGY